MKRYIVSIIALFSPTLVFATTGFDNFKQLVNFFTGIINLAIPVVVGIALLAFVWGLVQFIRKTDDPKNNKNGRDLMMWGVIALFVMITFKAIIVIAQGQLGIRGSTTTVLPYIKPSQ